MTTDGQTDYSMLGW